MSMAKEMTRLDAEAVLQGRVDSLEALRNEPIFMSGGTGFLGKWILELLAVLNQKYGFGVKILILTRTPQEFQIRWPHLANLRGVTLQEGDIRLPFEIPRDIRYVIHAAALTDRKFFASEPTQVAETNTAGTLRLFQAAEMVEDLRKVILVSSGLIYGRQPWQLAGVSECFMGAVPLDEASSVYAESKRFSEILARSFFSEKKLPAVVLRPFAFVGPYQPLDLPWAVTDFIRDSLCGGPIRIMGDGTSVRSIMYGSDFAFGVLSALAQGRPGEAYNLGSPEGIDMVSLAELITSNFSPKPEILVRLGQTPQQGSRLVPNTAKAEVELGVSPTVSLPQAIFKTIAWHKELRKS